MTVTEDHKISLEKRAEYARNRVLQQLMYHFGRAIPDLDFHGEADSDMSQLTDAIIKAAALQALLELQTQE